MQQNKMEKKLNNTIDYKEIAKIAGVVALGIFAIVGLEDFFRLFI